MKVFSTSNPHAMMSLAFSWASLLASSIVKSFHRNFSSSVICITSGTSKVSCSHLKEICAQIAMNSHFKTRTIRSRLAQYIERRISNWKVVDSNPTMDKYFHFESIASSAWSPVCPVSDSI